jgi:hypothetical protein
MNPSRWLMLLVFVLGSLTACANREHVYEDVYEGLKTRNRVYPGGTNSAPVEPAPSYGQYETERKKLLAKPESP